MPADLATKLQFLRDASSIFPTSWNISYGQSAIDFNDLPLFPSRHLMQVNIKNLIDEGQCYQTVRALCWPEGIICPSCQFKQSSSAALMGYAQSSCK